MKDLGRSVSLGTVKARRISAGGMGKAVPTKTRDWRPCTEREEEHKREARKGVGGRENLLKGVRSTEDDE